MVINQQKEIDILFQISGYQDYGFGTDKNLYNLKTGNQIKKCLKGYTRGFNLQGKFISQNQLKPLLKKVEKIDCPF